MPIGLAVYASKMSSSKGAERSLDVSQNALICGYSCPWVLSTKA
jgi:hypothetical protein